MPQDRFTNLFQADNPGSPPEGKPGLFRGLLDWVRARLGWFGPGAQPDTMPEEILGPKARAGPADMLLPWIHPYYFQGVAKVMN